MICIRSQVWLLVVVLFGCNNQKENQPVSSGQSELITSVLNLARLDGQSVNMDQYKGKILFINFWATWCKPCLQEMPSIQRAIRTFENENIEFLFASDEEAEVIEAFKKEHEYAFNYVRVENLSELNINALPTTFIFNTDGKLVFSEIGYRRWDSKENLDLISDLIKSK